MMIALYKKITQSSCLLVKKLKSNLCNFPNMFIATREQKMKQHFYVQVLTSVSWN
jgi:hypothetical protein